MLRTMVLLLASAATASAGGHGIQCVGVAVLCMLRRCRTRVPDALARSCLTGAAAVLQARSKATSVWDPQRLWMSRLGSAVRELVTPDSALPPHPWRDSRCTPARRARTAGAGKAEGGKRIRGARGSNPVSGIAVEI